MEDNDDDDGSPSSIHQGSYNSDDLFADLGRVSVYVVNEVDGQKIKKPIPYPSFYNNRREGLKMMNQAKYNVITELKPYDNKTAIAREGVILGRKGATRYELAAEHPLHTRKIQILSSKHRTNIFCGRDPAFPGNESDQEEGDSLKVWRKRADYFARYYLTMFRAEEECWSDKMENNYAYDWNALKE